MIDERVRKAHAIFVKALGHRGRERESYVADACASDAALRLEVDRLLDAIESSTDFLETPAIGGDRHEAAKRSSMPALDVQGYRIVRTLGVGGMASVFEAEQEHPKRLVALKVMHRSLTETSALQRFRFETEILARLKHPGIAQIYEAGTIKDDAGRQVPYFTMELVDDALPITQYAQHTKLDFRSRLELFAAVCDAVRCGHNAGVIHRDLKPSNVLVDTQEQVKVIDFGIARSLGPVETPITIDTERDRLIGTLNYMSPEQCEEGDIDTRSDVYSLGVMLYELVTGRLPLDLSKTSIPEAVRIIRDVAPTRPGNVTRDLPGDLELIVMTAIAKDCERRYPSASEFAADIRRFLANEPIQARPPTMLYQAKKFAQRHRALVAGSALMVVTLVAAVLVTSRMAYVANRAKHAAELREQELERVTEFHRSQLSDLDVAAMGERIRETLLDKLQSNDVAPEQIEQYFAEVNFPSVALSVIEESVLDRSRNSIDEQFSDQPLLRADLLQALAATMNTLGLADRAEPVLTDALNIRREILGSDHPDTLTSAHAMGSLLGGLGKYDAAYERLQDTYERRVRTLGANHPDTLITANSMGGILRYLGRLDEAATVWQQTLEKRRKVLGSDHPRTLISLNNVGVIHAIRGNLEGAEDAWRELLERRKQLYGVEHPTYRSSITNLGLLLAERGKLTEARALLEESLESRLNSLGEKHPSTLGTMSMLANLLAEMKDPGAASLLRRCRDARAEVLGPLHPDTLRTRAKLAAVIGAGGDLEQAATELRDVLAHQRDVLGSNHADAIESIHLLSNVLLELDEPEESYELALESVERSTALTPDASIVIVTLQLGVARALTALERFEEAEAILLKSHETIVAAIGNDNARTENVTAALAEFYWSWHSARPDAGYDEQAALWRNR